MRGEKVQGRKSKQPSLLGMPLANRYEPKEADSLPFLEQVSTCIH